MMLIQWFVGGLGTSLSCGQFALANLLASQEHLMTLISPRIRHIDRKRGEGLSFEKKRGMFRAFRSFLKAKKVLAREKRKIRFALIFPTKLSTFLSLSFRRLSPTL